MKKKWLVVPDKRGYTLKKRVCFFWYVDFTKTRTLSKASEIASKQNQGLEPEEYVTALAGLAFIGYLITNILYFIELL